MQLKFSLAVLSCCGILAGATWAAERAWHPGTIVAVDRQQRNTTVQHSDTDYTKDKNGKAKAETRTTTSDVPVEVYTVFTVTDGQKTYVARQGSTIWHSKINPQAGDKIQFAVEGDALYARQPDDSKEVKWKIIKSSSAPAPAGNH